MQNHWTKRSELRENINSIDSKEGIKRVLFQLHMKDQIREFIEAQLEQKRKEELQ